MTTSAHHRRAPCGPPRRGSRRAALATKRATKRGERERGETLIGVAVAAAVLATLLGLAVAAVISHQRAVATQTALEVARSHVARARARIRGELRYADLGSLVLSDAVAGPGVPPGSYRTIRFRRPVGIDPDGRALLGPEAILQFGPAVGDEPPFLLFSDDAANREPTRVAPLDGVCYFRFAFGDTGPAAGEVSLFYRIAAQARRDDGKLQEVGAEAGELTITLQNAEDGP